MAGNRLTAFQHSRKEKKPDVQISRIYSQITSQSTDSKHKRFFSEYLTGCFSGLFTRENTTEHFAYFTVTESDEQKMDYRADSVNIRYDKSDSALS